MSFYFLAILYMGNHHAQMFTWVAGDSVQLRTKLSGLVTTFSDRYSRSHANYDNVFPAAMQIV